MSVCSPQACCCLAIKCTVIVPWSQGVSWLVGRERNVGVLDSRSTGQEQMRCNLPSSAVHALLLTSAEHGQLCGINSVDARTPCLEQNAQLVSGHCPWEHAETIHQGCYASSTTLQVDPVLGVLL